MWWLAPPPSNHTSYSWYVTLPVTANATAATKMLAVYPAVPEAKTDEQPLDRAADEGDFFPITIPGPHRPAAAKTPPRRRGPPPPSHSSSNSNNNLHHGSEKIKRRPPKRFYSDNFNSAIDPEFPPNSIALEDDGSPENVPLYYHYEQTEPVLEETFPSVEFPLSNELEQQLTPQLQLTSHQLSPQQLSTGAQLPLVSYEEDLGGRVFHRPRVNCI